MLDKSKPPNSHGLPFRSPLISRLSERKKLNRCVFVKTCKHWESSSKQIAFPPAVRYKHRS